MQTESYSPRIIWTLSDGSEVPSSGATGSTAEALAALIIGSGIMPEGTPWRVDNNFVFPGDADIDRVSEIKAHLNTIDAESARPMRSIIRQTATEDDYTKLDLLEAEAEALRAELATLI